MAKDPRDAAFIKARTAVLRRQVRTEKDALKSIAAFLKRAQTRISTALLSVESESATLQLQLAQASAKAILEEMGAEAGATAADSASVAWRNGVDLVDIPIASGGIRLSTMLPVADTTQLLAMRTFLTGKLKDVAGDAVRKVNDELGLVILGAQSPSAAATAVQSHLQHAGRSRALGIVRTEVGRAFSVATQKRLDQAVEKLPGLKKQWRRSGKRRPRVTHAVADGQIVDVKKPFMVGGEALMYPRDPKGSPKNTIQCGCTSLPFMATWEVSHPLEVPLTDAETSASIEARNAAELREEGFAKWIGAVANGKLRATGNVETAGVIGKDILDKLKVRGITPATAEIGLSDRRVLHMLRASKTAKGGALSVADLRRLPMRFDKPDAVLLEDRGEGPALIYAFKVAGTERVAKIPVKLRDREKRSSRVRRHNFIQTATLVPPAELRLNSLELLSGKI